MKKIAILGAGNMGGAFARGLARNQTGFTLWLCDANEKTLHTLQKEFAFSPVASIDQTPLVDVLILAVKPQIFPTIAPTIKKWLTDKTLVISIMAGVSSAKLREALGQQRVIRTMPNLPLNVGQGVTAIAVDGHSEEDLSLAHDLFSSVGMVQRVLESQMDAVTALSGSGPAYVFEFVRGLVLAGIHQGLSEDAAYKLARQTVVGAMALLEQGGKPADWTLKVCSPGGTTIHGIKALEESGFYKSLYHAVEAAANRSRELGKG